MAAAAVGAALLVATQAFAHADLMKSNPAEGATVAAPKTITLTFGEKLVPAFSTFEVSMGGAMKMPVKTVLSRDKKSIVGTLQGASMPGVYKVTWHAASADGHKMNGTLSFKVR